MLLVGISQSSANERRFVYTYETSVLPPGSREIETWNTYRSGKNFFSRRLDQRIEYEFGVSRDLMSSIYLNYGMKTEDSNGDEPGGNSTSSYELGFSNEWKYKISDRVADPIGIGLYGEFTLVPGEVEIEGKLLFDKEFKDLLFAFNGVVEQEWESEVDNGETKTARELKVEFDLGTSYLLTSRLSAGVEIRQHNVIVDGEVEHSTLFAGPVISYAAEGWWATIAVQPQIKSFKGSTTLDLAEYEKFQARLLFSFHI
jgi:hypothetical protein